MSGGRFHYNQYKILNIAEELELYIQKCERKEKKDWGYTDEDGNYIQNTYEESEEVLNEFRKAVKVLREAYVYANRIDWLLSGDDGDETFLERLKKELSELDK